MRRYIDTASLVVAIITAILFGAALFVKGITHDLFLEVGVLLISVKILISNYQSQVKADRLEKKLDSILMSVATANSPRNLNNVRVVESGY